MDLSTPVEVRKYLKNTWSEQMIRPERYGGARSGTKELHLLSPKCPTMQMSDNANI